MQVLAVPLSLEVSLTLIQSTDGWRFRAWSRRGDGAPLPEPPGGARQQSFPTPETAVAFFRAFYPAR